MKTDSDFRTLTVALYNLRTTLEDWTFEDIWNYVLDVARHGEGQLSIDTLTTIINMTPGLAMKGVTVYQDATILEIFDLKNETILVKRL